jgi:pimeloyl-ACP methyl ester carboxylesterase
MRLFTSEILIALSASPISWIGPSSGGIHIVGWSMGGAVAASFAAYFPSLIASVVLLAPVGLVRMKHFDFVLRFPPYALYLPDVWLEAIVKKGFLKKPKYDMPSLGVNGHPEVNETSLTAWMARSHRGFVKAFISSMLNGGAYNQQEDWRRLRKNLDKNKFAGIHDRILVILGTTDPIVRKDEFKEDARKLMGDVINGVDGLQFVEFDNGHDFPVTMVQETFNSIQTFWSMPKLEPSTA